MDATVPADVLVVEDDPDINEMVGEYVRLSGYRYRPALDGETAEREAKSHPPALVLLDLMLPDIDGFEVCRRIHDNESTRDVPVVILSALSEEDCRGRARELGVREYLTKPFDPDALIGAIRRNVRSARGR